MRRDFYEVYRDGQPLHYLFYTVEQAEEWIKNHSEPEVSYEVQPFAPW